jgi:peptidoglycan/LPS O-acetylase OafA/YrhL
VKDGDPRHRIAYVDGLRAVAVLLVVAFHCFVAIPHKEHLSAVWAIFSLGKHGVDLFFVLSGFCLAYPTLKRLHDQGGAVFDISSFAAKRITRILPPYYLAIVFVTALTLILVHFGIQLSALYPFSWLGVVKNLLFLDGSYYYLNYSFWTLAVELRWYIVFPILLWVWCRSPRAFAAIAIACALAWFVRANSMDVSVLPAFMLGIVAADMRVRDFRLPFRAVLISLAAVAVALYQGDPPVSPAWQFAAFVFVVAAGESLALCRVLSTRLVAAVGLASYSIYLVHEPLINIMERYGVYPLLAGCIAIAFGFVFWTFAERPFVETSLRARIISGLQPIFGRWLSRIGIGRTMALPTSVAINHKDVHPMPKYRIV